MGKHFRRVATTLTPLAVVVGFLLTRDIPTALAQADRSAAQIASALGITDSPEHMASYVWDHPFLAIIGVVLLLASGAGASRLIEWAYKRWTVRKRTLRGGPNIVIVPSPQFDMSFNQLVRRVAYESDWAAKFSAETPGTQWQKTFWWKPLKKEILRALSGGDLVARGLLHERNKEPDSGPDVIPVGFWRRANFNPQLMLTNRDIGDAVNGDLGEIYTDIEVKTREVDSIWPARSSKAAQRQPSPFVEWHKEWWQNEELVRLNHQMKFHEEFKRAQRAAEAHNGE